MKASSLGFKLFAGFTAILLLTILVGAVGGLTCRYQAKCFAFTNHLNNAVKFLKQADLLAAVNRNSSAPELLAVFQHETTMAQKEIEQCMMFTSAPEDLRRLSSLKSNIDDYDAVFVKNHKLARLKLQAEKKRAEAETLLDDNLDEIISGMIVYMEVNPQDSEAFARYYTVKQALDFFNDIRIRMPDYLNNPEPATAFIIRKKLNNFREMLDNAGKKILSDRTADAFKAAQNGLAAYIQVYNEFESLSNQQRNCREAMQKTAGLAGNNATELLTRVSAATRQSTQRANWFMIFAVCAAVVVGLGLALRLTQNFTRRIKRMEKTVAAIAAGNLGERIDDDSLDELGRLSRNINIVPVTISRLHQQLNLLVAAGAEGHLECRGDNSGFQGVYKELLESMNQLLENIHIPVSNAISAMEKVAVYDFTPCEEQHGSGDYKRLSDAINATRNRLQDAQQAFVAIAAGDISMLEHFRAIGQYSAHDHFLPSIIAMMDALRQIIRDTKRMTEAVGQGDISISIQPERHRGAYRDIICNMNHLAEAMREPLEEMAVILNHLADKNLTVRTAGNYQGIFAELAADLDTGIDEMEKAVNNVYGATEQLESSSREMLEAGENLSQGATEQTAALHEITGAIHDLLSMTNRNHTNIIQAGEDAGHSTALAVAGRKDIENMVDAMEGIKSATVEISRLNQLIDEIAFQTNLLALNAALEAARAGKYGRGFAVVSSEVRNLAARSAATAQDTAVMLEQIVRKVDHGMTTALQTRESFNHIDEKIRHIGSLNAEISADTARQHATVALITPALAQISNVTAANTANAEHSAAIANVLGENVINLHQLLQCFSIRYSAIAATGSYRLE